MPGRPSRRRGTKAGNANTRYPPLRRWQVGHRNVNSSQREIKCHADAPSNRGNGFLSPTVFFPSPIVRPLFLRTRGKRGGRGGRLIVFLENPPVSIISMKRRKRKKEASVGLNYGYIESWTSDSLESLDD